MQLSDVSGFTCVCVCVLVHVDLFLSSFWLANMQHLGWATQKHISYVDSCSKTVENTLNQAQIWQRKGKEKLCVRTFHCLQMHLWVHG